MKEIKAIFDKHHTDYRIIINPHYDKVPLDKDQLELLESIFGKEYIFNFSGENEYNAKQGNFYDADHIRVHFGKMMLEEVYGDKQFQN